MEKKIMIIDDDRELLDKLSESLVLSGYDVTAINDTKLVIEMIDKIKPAVILLDIKMPGKDGFCVASEIKNISKYDNIPIIGMTGGFYGDDDTWLMNFCGIQKCFRKPFYPLDLINYIETMKEPLKLF
ncbi:MAG: response regulator [bacterium]|nr:response regulator [bacterium]